MPKKSILMFILLWTALAVNAQADSLELENDTVMKDVVVPPEFKGGMEKFYDFFYTNFQYPQESAKRSVSGTAEIEFVVEKSGDITHVLLLEGIDFSIDNVILDLMRAMPRWTPATKNGDPVRYKVSMPLTIRATKNKGLRPNQTIDNYRNE